MRTLLLTLIVCLGAVYAFNAVYATHAPPLDVTARFAATQTESDIIVSDNALYQRGWTRARLMRAPSEAEPCPDLVVLGSSAMGTFASEMLPEHRLVNGWHGNFSVQDMESYVAILDTAPCKPKNIVVGIDLFWSANAEWKLEGWQALAGDYASYQASRGHFAAYVPLQVGWDEYKENLGFARTTDTFRAVRQRGLRTEVLARAGVRIAKAEPLETLCPKVATREQNLRAWDGHYLKCPSTVMSAAAVAKSASAYLSANIHDMADWREVDTGRIDRIANVIGAWRARGFAVVMVGVPYHPTTWSLLTTDATTAPNIQELEQRLQRLARETGAAFVSLRDPASVPCTADEFEDSHHPRESCMRRVVAKVATSLVPAGGAPAPASR